MSPLKTRKATSIGAFVAAVVAVLGGVTLVASGDGGGGGAKPLLITAEAQRRTLIDEVTIQGTLGRVEQRQVDAAETGRISTVHIEDGATVEAGQPILSIDGRDSIATGGAFPFFRALDVGSEGDDVRQLEEILRDAGHNPGTIDRTYTEETRQALAAW
ncbi:MAG TPA: biotin/lipoyl-binding protein, partial [Acidimicrobiales bacterium]|nr:biotin/lipoyl-binding protein [Acidimicrobiales bacterium]